MKGRPFILESQRLSENRTAAQNICSTAKEVVLGSVTFWTVASKKLKYVAIQRLAGWKHKFKKFDIN